MDYFCVDVESSGPTPGIHNLLSVGVTHVRRFKGVYQPFEDLYFELRPIFPGFDEAAMRVNRLDPVRLESEGLPPDDAMRQMIEWVDTQRRGKKDRPVFVAHNAPFDWMFFAYYCGHAHLDNIFGYSALDTKALAMGKLGLPWNRTNLKYVASLVDASHPAPHQLHHAGVDARYLADVFCALMNRPHGPPAEGP